MPYLSGVIRISVARQFLWKCLGFLHKILKAQEIGGAFADLGHRLGKPQLGSWASVKEVTLIPALVSPLTADTSLRGSDSFTASRAFLIHTVLLWVWQTPRICSMNSCRLSLLHINQREVELMWGSLEKGISSEEPSAPEIADTGERPGRSQRGRKDQKPIADTDYLHLHAKGEGSYVELRHALLSFWNNIHFPVIF